MTDGKDIGLPLGNGSLPEDLDGAALFSLLIASLRHASAMVLDAQGTVVWCCPRCPKTFGCCGLSGLIGRPLNQVAPELWAAERAGAVSRACREGRTITLVGILNGQRIVTRCIPIPSETAQATPRALLVIEEAGREDIERLKGVSDGSVIWSQVHDLGPLEVLTPRELEVLALLGQGLRTKEIAGALHRSVSTIDGHRERIGQKLNVNDRAELVSIARKAGLRVEDAEGARVRLGTSCN